LSLELASETIALDALRPLAGEKRLARFSPVALQYAVDRGAGSAPIGTSTALEIQFPADTK